MHLALGAKDGDDLSTVFARHKSRNSLTFFTTQGSLRLCNVQWLVFEEPMFGILLSRPLIQALGFDIDEHLKTVRDTYQDCDFSHVCFSQPSSEVCKDIFSTQSCLGRTRKNSGSIGHLSAQTEQKTFLKCCWPLRRLRNLCGRLTPFFAVELINGIFEFWRFSL